MAKFRPGTLVDDEAAHGLEQQLIHALVECLSARPADGATPATRLHQDVLVRFEGLLQAQPEGNLRMTEICAALGVSERMLRECCKKHLGMGPSRYRRLSRMQQAHRALRSSDPRAMSVFEVAKRYGIRDLGRFAASYRALYGELPSGTLRRRDGVAELTLGEPRVKFP